MQTLAWPTIVILHLVTRSCLSESEGLALNPKGSPTPPMKVSAVDTLEKWQQLTGNDMGSTISANMDLQRVLAQAERYLQL